MPDILDVAVIGAGSRGATHLEIIARLTDRFRLTAVCDAREERRDWAAETYKVPTFDNPVALLDQARPHAIAIVIPPDAHHLVTAVAAQRGVHVLSETPMATTRAMCDDMIRTARANNVVLEISENVWRYSQERLKRLAVDAGLLGQVTQVHLWYRSGSYHGMNALRRFITTPPSRVLGFTRDLDVPMYRDLDGVERRRQSYEHAILDFGSGAGGAGTGQIAVYQNPVGSDRGNLWEVIGTRGSLMGTDLVLFDGPNGARRRVHMETIAEDTTYGRNVIDALRYVPGEGLPTVTWENPYRRYATTTADEVARADIYVAFHDAITAGKGTPETPTENGWPQTPPTSASFYGPENGRADVELLMAVRESAARGNTWLDLPLPNNRALAQQERRALGGGEEDTTFERQVHQEFERAYGGEPFSDPERLLGTLFPRRGLAQSVGNVIG